MKLCIYMKSGNKIVIPSVKDWELRYEGNEVVHLKIIYYKFRPLGKTLIMGALDLSQIEAITRHKFIG